MLRLRVLEMRYNVVAERRCDNLNELEMLLETAKTISSDKIIEAVSFSIRMNALRGCVVCVGFMSAFLYCVYKFMKFCSGKL